MALDPRQLRKVFLNLIVNGLDALEAGGTLAVRSRRVEPGVVEVAVEDTGCGMSEETRARIFDLFFTTKADGTGLGMGIARSVVELHDGTLEVESQPGCGTRVVVRLAIAEAS
jgi:signal transduction histidine kinase